MIEKPDDIAQDIWVQAWELWAILFTNREDDDPQAGDRPQQCAGLMAVLHRAGRENQIMQVAERLGAFDPSHLDPRGEAYGSIAEVVAAHD